MKLVGRQVRDRGRRGSVGLDGDDLPMNPKERRERDLAVTRRGRWPRWFTPPKSGHGKADTGSCDEERRDDGQGATRRTAGPKRSRLVGGGQRLRLDELAHPGAAPPVGSSRCD